MDEYLFIAVAKLKADRLRLEQEQRKETALQPREERASWRGETEPPVRSAWISRWNWREQS
jgi:hypothetical protein